MLIKSETLCEAFVANDGCSIRELLHPKNDSVELPFSLAIAEVGPAEQTYRHRLAQAEVYFILEGVGLVHVGGLERSVNAGDAVFIPPREVQWIRNTGTEMLKFAAIVSPAWRAEDDERLDR